MRTLLATITLVLTLAPGFARAQDNADPDPNMPRPIAARDSVWIEELTWLEVRYLKSLGIVQKPDVKSAQRGALHDDYHYESIITTVDPRHIRVDERKKAGLASIYGISVVPVQKTIANGKKLIEYRVGITVAAIKKALGEP
jgi:hypothetical protein